MSSATEQITGIIPVVVVGGIAMKMTDQLYDNRPKKQKGKRSRKNKMKFGDFSNLF